MEKPNLASHQQYHVIVEKQPAPKIKSLFGVEYDTWTLIFGFAVPLLSFLFGFLFSILRDRVKERLDIKISSETVLLWIKNSIKSSKTLLAEIDEKKTEVLKLDNFDFKRPSQISLHLARLTFNQEKIFKAFVKYRKDKKKDNSEDYTKLMVDLDFLADFQVMFYKNADYMVDQFQVLFNQWNNYLREFYRAKHCLLGKRAPFEKPSHLYSIDQLFNRWYVSKKEKLSDVNDFLANLEPFLNEFYSKDPSNDDVETLTFFTQQIMFVYKQFIYERDRYAELLANEYEQLNETIRELESLSNKISKKKFVLI